MPLLESDTPHDAAISLDLDDNFRPRTGSGGIMSYLKNKRRHKSSDDAARSSPKSQSPSGTPGSSSSLVKSFFGNFRPRSKSDAATKSSQPKKYPGSAHSAQNSPTATSGGMFFPRSPPQQTPMGQILEDGSVSEDKYTSYNTWQAGSKMTKKHAETARAIALAHKEQFRSRANSDPKKNERPRSKTIGAVPEVSAKL